MISLRGPIERSRVICLEGGKYQTAEIAYVLASQEISMGNKVYWVDGGSLLDPTRIELLSLRDPVSYLDSLHACRAFTAHQMSEIFRRMERSGDGGTELQEDCLLIVTSVHSMFLDTQLGVAEGNMLLRNTLERIRRISRNRRLAVLMTIDRGHKPPTPAKVRSLLKKVSDEFLVMPLSTGKGQSPIDDHPSLSDFT